LIALKDEDNKDELIGKQIEARVIDVTQSGRFERIIVNRKQLQYEAVKQAENEEFEKIQVNDIIKGKVTKITEFGAFVSLSDHV